MGNGIPIPPPLPRPSKSEEDDLHSHCLKCINLSQCLQPTNSCPAVFCGLNCGSRYHRCKEDEHKELCPHVLVPCINLLNGCKMSMLRSHRSKHLAACGVMRIIAAPFTPTFPKKVNIPKQPPLPMNRSNTPKPPSMPMNTSDGLHRHCSGCVNIGKCLQSPQICPVVFCLLECGSRFHSCKEDKHQELCPNLKVRCWFLDDGCQKTMLRRERTNHIADCEVINKSNFSYPQPFPTNRSNIPKPPPLSPMNRSSIPTPPPTPMVRSNIPIPPPPPMIRSNIREQPPSCMKRCNIPQPPPPPMNRTNSPKPPTNQLNTSIIPKPPPFDARRSDGLHRHCQKCFNPGKCQQTKSCPIVFCGLKCGSQYRRTCYHRCKEEEHQELCPNMLVPCINFNNGCQKTMLRRERSNHLAAVCEVIKKLAPLSCHSEKPIIPKPPPQVYGKMVMGKFVSIPPPPPGLFFRGQTIIPRPPPPVNGPSSLSHHPFL